MVKGRNEDGTFCKKCDDSKVNLQVRFDTLKEACFYIVTLIGLITVIIVIMKNAKRIDALIDYLLTLATSQNTQNGLEEKKGL